MTCPNCLTINTGFDYCSICGYTWEMDYDLDENGEEPIFYTLDEDEDEDDDKI